MRLKNMVHRFFRSENEAGNMAHPLGLRNIQLECWSISAWLRCSEKLCQWGGVGWLLPYLAFLYLVLDTAGLADRVLCLAGGSGLSGDP